MTTVPTDPRSAAVLEEALRKAAVLWVAPEGHPPVPVWVARRSRTVYVLCGGTEQAVPGLADATTATVSARSREDRALLVTWEAAVHPVAPGTPEWDDVTPLLLAGRLNLPDADDAAALARWAAQCRLVGLVPSGPVRPRAHHPAAGAGGDR